MSGITADPRRVKASLHEDLAPVVVSGNAGHWVLIYPYPSWPDFSYWSLPLFDCGEFSGRNSTPIGIALQLFICPESKPRPFHSSLCWAS